MARTNRSRAIRFLAQHLPPRTLRESGTSASVRSHTMSQCQPSKRVKPASAAAAELRFDAFTVYDNIKNILHIVSGFGPNPDSTTIIVQ
jgi:hypothetical protein